MTPERDKESVEVLRECIDLQLKKAQDYQSEVSDVTQAMYYRRGIDSIHDVVHAKILRIDSLIEKVRAGHDAPNFESIEDSYKDLINYASFAVSWLRGKMEGQPLDRDMFNQRLYTESGGGPSPGFQGVEVQQCPTAVKISSVMTDEEFNAQYCRTDSDIYAGAHGGAYKSAPKTPSAFEARTYAEPDPR